MKKLYDLIREYQEYCTYQHIFEVKKRYSRAHYKLYDTFLKISSYSCI